MHVHNHFPLLSPSIFDASSEAGVASVWTLHNYRATCANGLLFRDGRPCEDCVGRPPISGVVHRCYRGSLLGSAVVSAGIGYHRARGTWHSKVDHFIALSEFARSRHIKGGIPADKITVKPNFGFPHENPDSGPRHGAVFVGRLSPGKGVLTLLEAWRGIDSPLAILGDGPSRAELERIAPPNVRFMGHVGQGDIVAHLRSASVAIIPSLAYENFPMTVIDAFSTGTPVIASRLGAICEILEEGRTGKLFKAGDAGDVRSAVLELLSNPSLARKMGIAAKNDFEHLYSPEVNIALMNSIYGMLLNRLSLQVK
jgi:glycosyltransferase involved in cell wall biosynthesis